MNKIFVLIGSLNMLISVALGAFGAHGLKEKLSADLLEIYQTGVQYHMIHAVGILLIAIFSEKFQGTSLVAWSGWLLFIGIIIFSGSLYALSMTGIRMLGAITPFGGVAFIIGWLLLAIAALKA
ncbi:hypothetical protein BEP19_15255 [Ammoniphilus oxalaticus]|uniref:DUF423 domain-containing protein n=1 Tax=Ammoniphilus oxalaticus TaxID=66863 RepID=A0A419SD64_9BACL|nr:DUF423 domain-containing protein [Ammoniphilus oxalaticus]RKD21036.1 hypothetical protein BEP19_15255 [Ammoniphilus oxalaticus]